MSIDRCTDVRNLITRSLITGAEEFAGDTPEIDGVYAVTINTPTMTTAATLTSSVTQSLAQSGMGDLKSVELLKTDNGAQVMFHVETGGVRGL